MVIVPVEKASGYAYYILLGVLASVSYDPVPGDDIGLLTEIL